MGRLLNSRSHLIILLIFLCLGVLSGCGGLSEKQKDDKITALVVNGKIDEAKQKVVEYYDGDEDKQVVWMMAINDEISKDYIDKLEIQKDWTWQADGNYTYIKGRVKNIGDKTIRYFKITAQYEDKDGNVLDTDYTNSNENILSGNQKEFEIMHENNNDYYTCSIFVDEVSLE